jgi:ribosomal protein L11 methyltransferase
MPSGCRATEPTSTHERWLRAEIELGDLAAEPVERALLELGAFSIEYRDAGDQPLLEPAPGAAPLWDRLHLAALFRAQVAPDSISGAVAKAVAPESPPPMHFQFLQERDWLRSWRESLRPARFGGRLWVCPAGSPCPDPHGVGIELDPGLAFGTGSHPTTSLCLDWLDEQSLAGARLLDYGCGSGILAIAALALGAHSAIGVDVDPQALLASRENARRNGCLESLELLPAAEWPAAESFDFIVANILSGTLIELEAALRSRVRTGTRIAMSGILVHQGSPVAEAYGDWVRLTHSAERDGWALLTGVVEQHI